MHFKKQRNAKTVEPHFLSFVWPVRTIEIKIQSCQVPKQLFKMFSIIVKFETGERAQAQQDIVEVVCTQLSGPLSKLCPDFLCCCAFRGNTRLRQMARCCANFSRDAGGRADFGMAERLHNEVTLTAPTPINHFHQFYDSSHCNQQQI